MKLSELFSEVASTLPARRGNLYEQFIERVGKDGKKRRYGPYYVWTRCVDGKMVSDRVPREEGPRVREEIHRGEMLDTLIGKLWELSERMAGNTGGLKKKRRTRSTRQQRPL